METNTNIIRYNIKTNHDFFYDGNKIALTTDNYLLFDRYDEFVVIKDKTRNTIITPNGSVKLKWLDEDKVNYERVVSSKETHTIESLRDSQMVYMQLVQCPKCKGLGIIAAENCPMCNGEKFIPKTVDNVLIVSDNTITIDKNEYDQLLLDATKWRNMQDGIKTDNEILTQIRNLVNQK